MKSILVAGGEGFIRPHIGDRLLSRDDFEHLVVVDNFWAWPLGNLSHISGPRPVFIKDDIEKAQFDLTLVDQHIPEWSCAVSYEGGVNRTVDWFRVGPGLAAKAA